jgi:hypothetical protein
VWGGPSAAGARTRSKPSSPVARLVRPPGLGSPPAGRWFSSVLRPPGELPHELDGPLEVVDAARRSRERRPHAAKRPNGLRADLPRIHVGRCGFIWLHNPTQSAPLLPESHDLHFGLRGALRPRDRAEADREWSRSA